MGNNNSEITQTVTFKANDIIAESDILLQFKIREILRQCTDVDDFIKGTILRSEADRLMRESMELLQGVQRAEVPND